MCLFLHTATAHRTLGHLDCESRRFEREIEPPDYHKRVRAILRPRDRPRTTLAMPQGLGSLPACQEYGEFALTICKLDHERFGTAVLQC